MRAYASFSPPGIMLGPSSAPSSPPDTPMPIKRTFFSQRQVEETGTPVALRASSMLMHLEAIRAGTGRGVLPCYVGDGHPLLERLTPPVSELAAEYWIKIALSIAAAALRTRRRILDQNRPVDCRGGAKLATAIPRFRRPIAVAPPPPTTRPMPSIRPKSPVDRRRSAKTATAVVDPPPITPASASPPQAAPPSNPPRPGAVRRD